MMGEEFYAVIKIVTGEEIFSIVSIDDNDGDPIIILQNPVTIKMFKYENKSMIKIKPWLEIPDDDVLIIKSDKVVTMTEVKSEPMIEVYNQYISDSYNQEYPFTSSTSEVKISDKMGFISTVEEARKNLENIFNNSKDTKES